MNKTCKKCSVCKPEAEFPLWKKGENTCRQCHNARRTEQRRLRGIMQKTHVSAYMREYRIKNQELLIAKRTLERTEKPLSALWRQMSRKEIPVTISRKEFMRLSVPKTCPVLGIPISYDLSRDNIPSVDRIDPNKPYEAGNLAIISYRANMIKSVGSAAEHKMIADWMSKYEAFEGRPLKGTPLKVGSDVLTFGRERERV